MAVDKPKGPTVYAMEIEARRARDARPTLFDRTLDDEGVCTRCGAPDVHCMCPDVKP